MDAHRSCVFLCVLQELWCARTSSATWLQVSMAASCRAAGVRKVSRETSTSRSMPSSQGMRGSSVALRARSLRRQPPTRNIIRNHFPGHRGSRREARVVCGGARCERKNRLGSLRHWWRSHCRCVGRERQRSPLGGTAKRQGVIHLCRRNHREPGSCTRDIETGTRCRTRAAGRRRNREWKFSARRSRR
jgi:hypothetical protein